MKKLMLSVLPFLCVFISTGLSAEEYSLNDLYVLALERSETIKIAEEDLYISEREKDKALAALLPTLSAFGYHTRYSKEQRQQSFLLRPDYTNEWGLRLDQSLSTGGRELTALYSARKGIKKSRFDLLAVKERFLLDVAVKYYEVLRRKKDVEIAGENVNRLTRHRDAAETRLKVGEATKTTLLRAEAELAGAQSDLIKSENNLRLAKSFLAKTVNIKRDFILKEPLAGTDYPLHKTEFSFSEFQIPGCRLSEIECLKEIAVSERAEINSMMLQKKIAKDGVEQARGSYWPDISLEGVYLRQENEPSSSFGLNEEIYAGIKLDFTFFEGGLKRAELSEAKARLRQAEYSLSDLKRSIGVEVENSYLILKTEASVLVKLQAEVEYARDNYNAVTKQFQHGLSDSIDVIDANTLLTTTERELANAGYLYQLAILRLKRATGTLLKTVNSEQLTVNSKQVTVSSKQ
jgi:outer membrane protein